MHSAAFAVVCGVAYNNKPRLIMQSLWQSHTQTPCQYNDRTDSEYVHDIHYLSLAPDNSVLQPSVFIYPEAPAYATNTHIKQLYIYM